MSLHEKEILGDTSIRERFDMRKLTLHQLKHSVGIYNESGEKMAEFFGSRAKEKAECFLKSYKAVPELLHAIKEAQWLRDHIMGKERRVNWGDTFDIDFGRMNEAFLKFDEAAKIGKEAE